MDRLHDWATDHGISKECIAFYHSSNGEKRKRELEELLEKGVVRIICCTDAVGMVRQVSNAVLTNIAYCY